MVNTQSQIAHQEQDPYDENYLKEWGSHRYSKNILRRENPREINPTYLNTIDHDLNVVRKCLT